MSDLERSRPMGPQPALDGLRAVSVVAVIAYHSGASWMTGGFFGVEVFFVVSGYLITTLLLQERERTGRTDLVHFWIRRARRLLPALCVMLVAVSAWVAWIGTDEQQSTLRRDLPWSIFYVNNWGQIVGSTPYFAPIDPPLLRHLWSLAVEEQWYVAWPILFIGLMGVGRSRTARMGVALIAASISVMGATALLHGAVSDNTLYLSTPTRASGLLLGAGVAFVWKPWRRSADSSGIKRAVVDVGADAAGWLALGTLGAAMVAGSITAPSTYLWALAVVSIASVVLVGAAVTPGATTVRRALGWRPLELIGQRSYGLYLWHWPALVLAGAAGGTGGSLERLARVVAALVAAAGLNELTYRYVEVPVRINSGNDRPARDRQASKWPAVAIGAGALATVAALTVVYVKVEPRDHAVGSQSVQFDDDSLAGPALEAAAVPRTSGGAESTVPDVRTATTPNSTPPTSTPPVPTTTMPATTTTVAALPRRLVIVGDSQAHSFAVNLPTGFDDYFEVTDGSVDGCGVLDAGAVRSSLAGFGRDLRDCVGWAQRWADDATRGDAEVALVMLGAWDVFDLLVDGLVVPFGSPEADARWTASLQLGIDALVAGGSQVALLEVPCMRPVANSGARVPPLPERGDDTRIAHLNELLRVIADQQDAVWFVKGPHEWCDDPTISTDVDYRWDGVHVYQQGASLIASAIALPLLQIPVPG